MSHPNSRIAAADLLVRCLDEKRTLEDAMGGSPIYNQLRGPDRGFARAMASAALRQLGRIDLGLAPFLDRPLQTATPPARALLRVGAAQAWLLETPDHAVVSETVAAAKSWPRAARSAGFLNAVLRKVVADRSAFDAAPLSAIWPVWLKDRFYNDLGTDRAEALLDVQIEAPKLHLTLKDHTKRSDYAARLEAKAIGNNSLELEPTDVTELPGYGEGEWWVQDVAAALPVQLLGAVAGERAFDLCAAPGGKTLQLASRKSKVTAVDRSGPRLRRLRENLKRVGFHKSVDVVQSALSDWSPPGLADRILLDAPCSALGTLRRHPEGAWIKSEADVNRFSDLQSRLVRDALQMLKPGGTLIYCVCTPVSHEGVDVVSAVVDDGLAVRLPIVSGECGAFTPCLTEAGDVLTLPISGLHHDAFFISRLTRPG